MSETVLVILDHEIREDRLTAVNYWEKILPREQIILAWGGSRSDYQKLDFPTKIFIEDTRLRIKDYQREKLSFTFLFKEIQKLIKGRSEKYLLFIEGDCFPVRFNVIDTFESIIKSENVDCIFSKLRRIDGTNHPHQLGLVYEDKFIKMLEELSIRKEKNLMLKCVGTPIFMKKEILDTLNHYEEPEAVHLEEYIPSMIYHLGFGIANLPNHDNYSFFAGGYFDSKNSDSALLLHPVKDFEGEWPLQ